MFLRTFLASFRFWMCWQKQGKTSKNIWAGLISSNWIEAIKLCQKRFDNLDWDFLEKLLRLPHMKSSALTLFWTYTESPLRILESFFDSSDQATYITYPFRLCQMSSIVLYRYLPFPMWQQTGFHSSLWTFMARITLWRIPGVSDAEFLLRYCRIESRWSLTF